MKSIFQVKLLYYYQQDQGGSIGFLKQLCGFNFLGPNNIQINDGKIETAPYTYASSIYSLLGLTLWLLDDFDKISNDKSVYFCAIW